MLLPYLGSENGIAWFCYAEGTDVTPMGQSLSYLL